MPGPRMKTEVLEAQGRKHLSNAEKQERKAKEVNVESPKYLVCPKWLTGSAANQFKSIQALLCKAKIVSKLDTDMLAAYCIHYQAWKSATNQAISALNRKDLEKADKWSRIQERYFKQARNSANDLGLTVTSRCRLVLPKVEDEPEDEFSKWLERQAEARRA